MLGTKLFNFRYFSAALAAMVFLLPACGTRPDASALDSIKDLGPFEEFARYNTVLENLEPGKRGTFTETPKLVVVIRKGLTKPELERITAAFIRANPGIEIFFFDSKDGLDNYVNLDSFDPRNNYKSDMTLDDDFTTKHVKARVQKINGTFEANTDPYVPYGMSPKKSPSPQ